MQIHTVRKNKDMHKKPDTGKNSGKPDDRIFLIINPPSEHNHAIIKNQPVAPMLNALQPVLNRLAGQSCFQIMFKRFPHISNHQC